MLGNGGDIQIIMLRLSPRFCDVIGKRVEPPFIRSRDRRNSQPWHNKESDNKKMLSDDHHNIHTVQKFDRDNNNINLNKILTKCEQK